MSSLCEQPSVKYPNIYMDYPECTDFLNGESFQTQLIDFAYMLLLL